MSAKEYYILQQMLQSKNLLRHADDEWLFENEVKYIL